jgi:transposase InsO family protein
VLKTVDDAVAAGFAHTWACSLWLVSDDRVHRWRARRGELGTLEDLAPGGDAVHALMPWEEAEVLALVEQWGTVDRSHRKLAHRGSYTDRVWVSPATVRRILLRNGLVLPAPPAQQRPARPAWPEWLEWAPNRVWCWDATHFPRAKRCAFAIVDVVSRKWLATVCSAEETSSQVQLVFADALEAEGIVAGSDPDRDRPLLLAMSDNGGPMISGATRQFFAALAIAQRLGRPGTPADQAWIESMFGHVKADWPHLETITDPAVLASELDRVRTEYNTVRLHAGIGYVTPDDEHTGRGDHIREARRQGLARAHQQRLAYHRRHTTNPEETGQ